MRYPLRRVIGGTLYPGLTLTAGTLWRHLMVMKFRQFGTILLVVVVMYLMTMDSSSYVSGKGHADWPKRYIAKSFFERYQYDTSVQEVFDSYTTNGTRDVFEDKKYILPTLSRLHRCVAGEGSHRHLSTSITFSLHHKLKSYLNEHSCEVVIIERLPCGVFTDPFELQHLVERGVFSDAAVFGDQNLELPSFRSNESVVEIHMSTTFKVLKSEDDLEVNLKLPLHARYPPLAVGRRFSRVEFGQPDLFICSRVDTRCVPVPSSNNKSEPVIWEIPSGSPEHASAVSFFTFAFAILAAIAIVLASVCSSDCRPSIISNLSLLFFCQGTIHVHKDFIFF